MEIVWLGHSSLRLQSSDVTLITDPYPDSVGFSIGNPSAHIVTISNDHPHHSHPDAVQGDPRVLKGPGEHEISDFYIRGMGTGLGGPEGGRQVNTVFTLQTEGLTLCHLGDLDQRLSPTQVEGLNQTDILFVPAGGTCTMDIGNMAALVNLIAPRIVIPVHYWVQGIKVELEPVDRFLAEMGITEAAPQARLNVNRSNLPRELSVVLLQRAL